jgi:hypothetical protein
MPHDESLELPGQQDHESISSDAVDWGKEFVKRLRLEYSLLASDLPAKATCADFQRAMMVALGRVFDESGGPPEDSVRFCEEIAGRFLPVTGDTAWNRERNLRRMRLIDKKTQQTITSEETVELMQLTGQMRAHCDREEMVPLEGARKLHRRLLDRDDSGGVSS